MSQTDPNTPHNCVRYILLSCKTHGESCLKLWGQFTSVQDLFLFSFFLILLLLSSCNCLNACLSNAKISPGANASMRLRHQHPGPGNKVEISCSGILSNRFSEKEYTWYLRWCIKDVIQASFLREGAFIFHTKLLWALFICLFYLLTSCNIRSALPLFLTNMTSVWYFSFFKWGPVEPISIFLIFLRTFCGLLKLVGNCICR